MNLRDGVIAVRNKLGEGTPWLFTDDDIIRDLNLSARGMCSAAQAIRDTFSSVTALNPTAGDGIYFQEYAMPQNCECPYAGRIQTGGLWPLDFSQTQESLQQWGFAGGAPIKAYVRRGVVLTQQTPSGGLVVQPAPGNTAGIASWVVGFYPVPSNAYNFFIDYVAYHPTMTAPADLVLIPDTADFSDAWIAFAVARGKEKEGDMVSADRYLTIYKAGVKQFAEYMLGCQAQVTPPQWGGDSGMSSGPLAAVLAPTASQLTIQ